MSKRTASAGGVSVPVLVFIVFLVLKLTKTILWSWWWVTSPLWIPLAVVSIAAIVISIVLRNTNGDEV